MILTLILVTAGAVVVLTVARYAVARVRRREQPAKATGTQRRSCRNECRNIVIVPDGTETPFDTPVDGQVESFSLPAADSMTVREALDYADGHPPIAERLLREERDGKARVTLISGLNRIITTAEDPR